MQLPDILSEWLRENLLLFRDPEKYRAVVAVRSIAFVILLSTLTAIYLVLTGAITMDIGFVVGVFAIFISWLFFWSSERALREQMQQLQSFLRDFRTQSDKRFDTIVQRFDSIFTSSNLPTPPPPGSSPDTSDQDTFATALSEVMKKGPKQFLIGLYEYPRPLHIDSIPITYTYELGETVSKSSSDLPYLAKELAEMKLIAFDVETGAMSLSDRGRAFAKWLTKHDQKAQFFDCPMLGIRWGHPSERYQKVMQKWKKQEDDRKRSQQSPAPYSERRADAPSGDREA